MTLPEIMNSRPFPRTTFIELSERWIVRTAHPFIPVIAMPAIIFFLKKR